MTRAIYSVAGVIMSGSNREQTGAERDNPHDLGWLDVAPVAGAPELPDEQVPILDEPPIVTEARHLPGGPYLLAPDSAEQMPTDFLAVQGDEGIANVIEQARTAEGQVVVPDDQRAYLEAGGQAAKQLLETLSRGLEATTPTLEAASIDRLTKASLL
jgi:hypothetical protein